MASKGEKNQKGGSSGTSTQTTTLSSEQSELNDLYYDINEEENELSVLGAELANAITDIDRANNIINREDFYDLSEYQQRAAYTSLNLAQQEYGRVTQLYREQRNKVERMNQRIDELEQEVEG